MTRSLKLWSFADVDRSGKVRWAARELGYDIEECRLSPPDVASEPYRALNAYQQVPTVEIEGQVWVESTAICLMLAERHPESGLIPHGQDARAQFWQSIATSTTTLEAPVVLNFLARNGILDERWAELTDPSLSLRLDVFSRSLPEDGFIAGSFSLADICAAYVLRLGIQAGFLSMEGNLAAYIARLRDRPAAIESRIFDSLQS